MLAAIRALANQEVLVGYPEKTNERTVVDGEEEDGINNPTLARIMDKGSPKQGIAAGNFMEDGVENVRPRIENGLKQAGQAAMDGNAGKVEALLMATGQVSVDGIKDKIRTGPWPKLAKSTLAARKRRGVTRTNRYVDTGQLINSTTFVLRKRRR
jgi:hypothetical protein